MSALMFWETLWALVLGFTLSGAVQAFVPREAMERSMGNHRFAAVARASGWGMVSSSCSYAATAMAKSLFAKGADFVTAMVFMFASTNLVIELGIVLLVLMGWQFFAAEFVGGPMMIALFVLLGSMVLPRHTTDPMRARVTSGQSRHHHDVAVSEQGRHELERGPWWGKLTSAAEWSDAAAYAIADITMLRRELVIGYLVAGVIAVYVRPEVWRYVFFQGHGFLTTLENVILGPFIAIVSFVCSIGNVPLAAALWRSGLGFGGVVSFIFADLITLPLLLIYRKYYGTKLALRLLATFWAVMSAAGLLTELLFEQAKWIPTGSRTPLVEARFAWNYTSVLNIILMVLLGLLFWLYRNRQRLGGGAGYAIDPVCGMQVRMADAPASTVRDGRRVWFCSDRCRERFEEVPSEGTPPARSEEARAARHDVPPARDPVCGMAVTDPAAPRREQGGRTYLFCCEGCADAFTREPHRYQGRRHT